MLKIENFGKSSLSQQLKMLLTVNKVAAQVQPMVVHAVAPTSLQVTIPKKINTFYKSPYRVYQNNGNS